MKCEDCSKEVEKVISIEIALYKDYEKIKKIHSIDFCFDCFKKTPIGSFIDERVDLKSIIED